MGGRRTIIISFSIGASFIFILNHFAPSLRFDEKEIQGIELTNSASCGQQPRHLGLHSSSWMHRHQDQPYDGAWSILGFSSLSALPRTTCPKVLT